MKFLESMLILIVDDFRQTARGPEASRF